MTLTAYADLSVIPVSFDFCVFLVKAELARRKANAQRLHVVIVPDQKGPGGFRDKSQFYDQHEARWRLWNICIPACALIGASVTLATDWEQARKLKSEHVFPSDWDRQTLKNRRHLIGDVITACRMGVEIPYFSASAHALRKVCELYGNYRVVTMTLPSTYLPERNADRVAWSKAREYIESCGYRVERIDDVNTALSRGAGYAELNLDLRMAMYQLAALNLQSNNGTASLNWFSGQPWRMFDAGVGGSEAEWRNLFVEQGLPWGESWPWCCPQQRIVYERASLEVIKREFDLWRASSE